MDIPDTWRKPPYEDMSDDFIEYDNRLCIKESDLKKNVRNRVLCESIRKGLIQFIDDVNSQPH